MLYLTANKLKRIFTSNFVFRLLNPRRTHIYCVGTAKSGTHSIAAIFYSNLRSAHEPEHRKLIEIILKFEAKSIDHIELRNFVLNRDKRLWLEVDSSQLNFFILEQLVSLFPNSKYILTIRNPLSWLDSFINHQIVRGNSYHWIQMRNLRFRPDIYSHSKEERILKDNGLYTLDGYLSNWSHHNNKVIDTVPSDRLLIVRTDEINKRYKDIVNFMGVPRININKENLHVFKAKRKYYILDKIDKEYLDYKVKGHCGELIAKFFPEAIQKVV